MLRQAGFRFDQRPSDVDEEALTRSLADAPASEVVLALAKAKAEAVAADPDLDPDTLVLGCDSLLELDGQVYGKPYTPERAIARWRRQRGRTANLLTGHWLVPVSAGDRAVGRTVSSAVTFVDATDAEIDDYVASGEPLGVAGAFTLEGRAGPLIAAVNGDPSNVLGLSLPGLRAMLGELGVSLASVTRPPTEPVGETRLPGQTRGS